MKRYVLALSLVFIISQPAFSQTANSYILPSNVSNPSFTGTSITAGSMGAGCPVVMPYTPQTQSNQNGQTLSATEIRCRSCGATNIVFIPKAPQKQSLLSGVKNWLHVK